MVGGGGVRPIVGDGGRGRVLLKGEGRVGPAVGIWGVDTIDNRVGMDGRTKTKGGARCWVDCSPRLGMEGFIKIQCAV